MAGQTTLSDVAAGGDSVDGRQCLSLTVSGAWGHFRRVDGNTVKATYRLPPRTTVAGLLAAIVGRDRDDYYETFTREESGVAVQPTNRLRTINLPENSLTTASEGMKSVNARGKVTIRYPDPDTDRQRSNYEVLVNPAYRIDVWMTDDAFYESLRDRLAAGESYYTPSLGLSEHLAEIEYHGEFTARRVDADGAVAVDSAVPDPDGVVPNSEVSFGTERSPGYMEQTSGPGEFTGRRTTGFLTQAYPTSNHGSQRLVVDGVEVYEVGDRQVVFA